MEKKALGKGLQALLPEKKTLVWKVEEDTQAISAVDVKHIIPNRYQPRTIFVEEHLEELTQSIKRTWSASAYCGSSKRRWGV